MLGISSEPHTQPEAREIEILCGKRIETCIMYVMKVRAAY